MLTTAMLILLISPQAQDQALSSSSVANEYKADNGQVSTVSLIR